MGHSVQADLADILRHVDTVFPGENSILVATRTGTIVYVVAYRGRLS